MKKSLLFVLILSAGAISFATFHRAEERALFAFARREVEWRSVAQQLAESNAVVSAWRDEISAKQNQLLQLHLGESGIAALLSRLEANALNSDEWAELRREFGIGWDSSPDYLLISKRVLKKLSFQKLSASQATDAACAVLAISSDEQSRVKGALRHARDSMLSRVERTEPAGDVVAQYTIPATDPAFDRSISTTFSNEITDILGTQRAGILLDSGLRELTSELGLNQAEPETMTIRRYVVDGEPKYFCECSQGNAVSSSELRYGTYPSCFCMALFPGGWEEIAQLEGFDLPTDFWK